MASAESTLPFTATATPAAYFSPPATYLSDIKSTAYNITTSFLRTPSARDLTHLPLRIASQIDHAVFRSFPRFVLQNTGLASLAGGAQNAVAAGVEGPGGAMAEAAGQGVADAAAQGWSDFFAEAFQASTFKSYWGMLHYLTSRWAFTCFVMALILNRISIYGATRQRIYLTWNKRLALRLLPIMLFIPQIVRLLQAIRCQTSPEFSLYRHGDNMKYSLLDWSTDGGVFHTVSSKLLYGYTDEQCCAAVGLSRPSPDVRAPSGSFSLLWPTFLRLSVSHVVESLSASLQQMPQMTEVGMSVFEHSLAFAEAETMISHTLGLGLFGTPKGSSNTTTTRSAELAAQTTIPASGTILAIADATAALTGPHVLDRVNVPVEVLLVALLSSCNALSSHIISVFGKQRQWRLVNTGIWGMAFMGSFVWGFTTTSRMVRSGDDGDHRPVSSLLHFPTVAIVGFLPHMTILLGIFVCSLIYLVALTLTAISLGTNPSIPQPSSLKERFTIAHENLQAAIQFRGANIRWYEDFYTALLRVGFAALTAASEAVFLNEGRSVEMRQFTWLEEDRLDELHATRNKVGDSPGHAHFQIIEEYGLPPSSPGGTDKGGVWESGYSKERKFDKKEGELEGKDSFAYPTPKTGGVGAVQRTTRFYLLFIYMRGIMFLIAGWFAFGIGVLLDRIGITARPRWLRKMVGRSLKRMAHDRAQMDGNGNTLDFWLLNEDGKLQIPGNDDLDIEPEMRKRVLIDHESHAAEDVLDKKMYDWWKSGGWFGTKDESGDYQPSILNEFDDTTSFISMSTANASESASEADAAWESESDGRRTPTQIDHRPTWSFSNITTRESTPDVADTPLDAATLARLLNPQDKESREEARILASHLSTSQISSPQSARIMTRSRYRQEAERERARILLAGRTPRGPASASVPNDSAPSISLYNSNTNTHDQSPSNQKPCPLTSAEEAEILESLILSRRKNVFPKPKPLNTTDDDDTEPKGPPCVVCQSSARTIIAWPCRCLCVCEDCRVSLALNNFGNCVTCRRTVSGFVRLYVP